MWRRIYELAKPYDPLVSPYPQDCTINQNFDSNDYHLYRGIVSFAKGYESEIAAVHNISKRYFLGETNSGA